MFKYLVFFALLAVAFAAPEPKPQAIYSGLGYSAGYAGIASPYSAGYVSPYNYGGYYGYGAGAYGYGAAPYGNFYY
ncbi:hypothetical protein HHI36_020431 [Cryptolaemus montrouzieri]|uniref:Uncharacterized protein n=1 Tax=Cryptolaemus montrouzieri TaxID=559131 RepID=A0ABD2NAP9_9CUCU